MSMRTSIKKNRGLRAATAFASITLLAGPLAGCVSPSYATPARTASASRVSTASPAVTGTAVFCGSVSARSYDTYRDVFVFRAHQSRTVVVEGDHDTDLDCWLYDENGNMVSSDTDRTDVCVLEITPNWTGEFSLRVANLGHVYNNYCVATL
jgi:hypothetical protein